MVGEVFVGPNVSDELRIHNPKVAGFDPRSKLRKVTLTP
jgi:hypothetical protein